MSLHESWLERAKNIEEVEEFFLKSSYLDGAEDFSNRMQIELKVKIEELEGGMDEITVNRRNAYENALKLVQTLRT